MFGQFICYKEKKFCNIDNRSILVTDIGNKDKSDRAEQRKILDRIIQLKTEFAVLILKEEQFDSYLFASKTKAIALIGKTPKIKVQATPPQGLWQGNTLLALTTIPKTVRSVVPYHLPLWEDGGASPWILSTIFLFYSLIFELMSLMSFFFTKKKLLHWKRHLNKLL